MLMSSELLASVTLEEFCLLGLNFGLRRFTMWVSVRRTRSVLADIRVFRMLLICDHVPKLYVL